MQWFNQILQKRHNRFIFICFLFYLLRHLLLYIAVTWPSLIRYIVPSIIHGYIGNILQAVSTEKYQ